MLTYNVQHLNFVVINNIILYFETRITSISKDKDKEIITKTTRNFIIIIMSLVFKDYVQLVEIKQNIKL